MDKFMQQMREAFANEALWKEFQTGIWDTIYSTVAATLVACVLGIILGIILVAGEEDGVRPLPGPVMKVLNFAINILRSVPFLILMIMVLPLSELLVGTSIGTVASIPPLIIASASFVARLVETSLREVDKGVIEAAQSMGSRQLGNLRKGHAAAGAQFVTSHELRAPFIQMNNKASNAAVTDEHIGAFP